MKFCLGIVVAALALNCVLAMPAHSPNDDAEVIDVPRRPQRPSVFGDDDRAGEKDFHDFKGVIDTGSGYPFLQPVPHPFSFNLGFFDSFEDIFRRLRTRLWPLELAAAGEESGEENGGSGFSFNLSPKNGNTTHTVKVVDGHKIEINDTVYGDNNSVFKVRVVNIRPLESGESVDTDSDTVSNTNNAGSPVTSAPAATNVNKNNENDDDTEDSDERREPLEDDKKPIENEINANIDDPEIAVAIEMLPTTTPIDEADAANLNAEFVTDNTLESGSAEAETNKADDANMEHLKQQHDDEETALAAELSDEKLAEDVSQQHNEQLTVENDSNNNNNNGAAEYEPETADNFNESNDDEAVELTKAEQVLHREDSSSDEDVVEEGVGDVDDETAKLSAELNEQTDKDIDAVSAEFDAESISITQQNQQNEDNADSEDDDDVRQSSMKHSNYAAKNKQREDVTSSDDENSDSDETNASRPMQMQPQFEAEWETLAEDLAAESNDLSNDIDIYDAVAPVDLSNDLAVNDIAASQPGFPINPDAEFIEVDGTTITKPSLLGPKFEKLSLGGVGDVGGAARNSTTSYQQHAKQYSQNFK